MSHWSLDFNIGKVRTQRCSRKTRLLILENKKANFSWKIGHNDCLIVVTNYERLQINIDIIWLREKENSK